MAHDARVWSNLELANDSHSNLDEILQSYFGHSYTAWDSISKGLARYNLKGRMVLPLGGGSFVNLALKKMIYSGKVNYVVNITIT